MAVNSEEKRRSALGVLFPYLMLPKPSGGNLEVSQRAALASRYYGQPPAELNIPVITYYRRRRNYT